jgi:hypothetical protein
MVNRYLSEVLKMNRYVATETGEMMRCEKGAWVKHDDYERIVGELEQLMKENDRLCEALRKVGEYRFNTYYKEWECLFCKGWRYEEHKDDCEYIRLVEEYKILKDGG